MSSMDGTVYKATLAKALRKRQFVEVQHLIETHCAQYPEETEDFLVDNIACRRHDQIEFELVKDLKSIVHLREELITVALTDYLHKHWRFLWDALFSDWDIIVLDVLQRDHDYNGDGVNEYLNAFMRQLYHEREISSTHEVLEKLCSLVVEKGMFHLFTDMVGYIRLESEPDDVRGIVDPDFVIFVYRCLLKVCTKDNLRKVLEAVRSDDRNYCQYLVMYLAARLRQWKVLRHVLENRCFVPLAGSDEMFVRALSGKAWTCAAYILQNVMQSDDSGETGLLLDIQFRTCSQILSKQGYNAYVLRPYLRKCIRHKRYAAGALVAAWAKKWKYVKTLLSQLHQGITDMANITVLEEIMKNRKFRMVYEWLQHPTQQELGQQYVKSLLWESVVSCRHEQARAMVEHLLMKCDDRSILGQVLYHIVLFAQPGLLHKFVTGGLLQRADDLGFALECAVDMATAAYLSSGSERCREDPRFRILLMLLEAGCTQCEAFSLHSTVKQGCVPVLQLLYNSGALAHSRLAQIRVDMDAISNKMDEQCVEAMRTFLQQEEGTPPSLKMQCYFHLSQQMGCGADRKQRALSLGLPLNLTRQILLLGSLYPD